MAQPGTTPVEAANLRRALVVDDEFLIRWSVRARLSEAGWQVSEAGTLQEARRALKAQPAVVVLDVKLPDGDGLDLLAEMRNARSTAQVLVITAHGNEDTAARARALGAAGFLTKPFDLDALVAAAERAVARA